MKTLFTMALFIVMTTQSFAAVINSAKMDAEGKNILASLTYNGGCKEHDFKLDMYGCYETNPPLLCIAVVVDATEDDTCNKITTKTIAFPLADYNLDDSIFAKATLRIFGDNNSTGKPSEIEVKLP